MRTAMRPRYYCDHCNKGNGSPSAMRRHERGCTLNPQRVCGMCKMLADEGGPEPSVLVLANGRQLFRNTHGRGFAGTGRFAHIANAMRQAVRRFHT